MKKFVLLFGRAIKNGFDPKDTKDALTIIGPFDTKELAVDYWSENIRGSVWVHEIKKPKR